MQSLWMILAAFLFAAMSVCIKLAASFYSTSEIMFYRGVLGAIFIGVWALALGLPLSTPRFTSHVRRGSVGITGQWFAFYALGVLPIATAMTLSYTSSIFIALIVTLPPLLAGRALKRADPSFIVSILLGFAGVVLLLRPTVSSNPAHLLPALGGLASGLLGAMAVLQVQALGRSGEPEWRIVFYFSVLVSVVGIIGSFIEGGLHAHTYYSFFLLFGTALFATLAQLAMTRAFSRGRTLFTANLQYAGVVFGSLFGLVIFGTLLPLMGWIGMAMIVASGMLATFVTARQSAARARAKLEKPS